MKKLLLLFFALLTGVSGAWATTYTVTYSTSTGSYTETNNDGTWAKKWVSTATNPQLTISVGSNNIKVADGSIWSGSNGCTYTLTAQEGYVITGYTITGRANNSAQTLTPAAGGSATSFATTGTTTLAVSGIALQSTSFNQSTPNTGIAISSFTVTLVPTYTVTYTIVDGGATVSGGSAIQALGSAPNIANTDGANAGSSYNNPYCTYSYFSDVSCETPITEITGACTVYAKITATSDIPVEFASSVDDVDAQWYTLKLRDYQFYVSGETVALSSTDITSASAQWVFTGTVCNAYVYNKSAEKYLVMSNGACALSDTPQPWILAPHQSGAGFYLYYASDYKFPFRNASGNLAYSTGPFYETANAASFVATGIKTNYKEDIIANVKPFFTTGVDSNFGLKSAVQSTYADRVTAAETTCNADEYSALLGVVSDPSNFVYPASGYYRIKNYSTQNYLGKTGSAPTIEFANTDAASVLYLTRSGAEGSYTYTIKMQGASYTGTKNQATGNYTLAIVAPGRFTMNDFNSNTIFGYTYANGTAIAEESLATGGDAAYWTMEDATSFEVTLNSIDNSNYYATLCVPFAVTMPQGVTANTITISGTEATPTAVEGTLTAGTPVLLTGNSSSATLSIVTGTAPVASVVTGTGLTGTFTGISNFNGATNYVLGSDGTKVGFFHWDGTALGANRAFVAGSSVNGVKGFYLNWGDEDAISSVVAESQSQKTIYNLAGQRVQKAQKGLYIINGKKVVIK